HKKLLHFSPQSEQCFERPKCCPWRGPAIAVLQIMIGEQDPAWYGLPTTQSPRDCLRSGVGDNQCDQALCSKSHQPGVANSSILNFECASTPTSPWSAMPG